MNMQENPITFDTVGDITHDEWPNQHVYIKRMHIYGGAATGNLMILDHEGHTVREGGNRHSAEPVNLRDPRIIFNSSVANDSFTVIEVNKEYRGIYLEDIPAGGKVDVYHGER